MMRFRLRLRRMIAKSWILSRCAWARYCTSPAPEGEVLPFASSAAGA
jgi:hypothetical protein